MSQITSRSDFLQEPTPTRRGRPPLVPYDDILRLREQGWTLQRIADRYGVAHSTISMRLHRQEKRPDGPRAAGPCVCGCGRLPRLARFRFFSHACYIRHRCHLGPRYIEYRPGQRVARRVVAQHFPLQPQHIVHHVDKDTRNNAVENLWVFASHAEHLSFHRGGSGQPIWRGDAIDTRESA